MTNCILSPPLRAVADMGIYVVFPAENEEEVFQSLREENVTGTVISF